MFDQVPQDDIHRELTRHLSGAVPAHAVGHYHHPAFRQGCESILIHVPDQSLTGPG
jgi:hypothetical protein